MQRFLRNLSGVAFWILPLLTTFEAFVLGDDINHASPAIERRPAHADGDRVAATPPHVRELQKTQRARSDSHIWPAPRGPVRIIHIEGTDILLIVGQGVRRGFSRPLPRRPVSIDLIEDLDLLIIRGQEDRLPERNR